MIDEIKNTIINDPLCELSIDELIELSNLDYCELVKIFGKKYIARYPEDITLDTICYVGDLYVDNKLPICNLKYIFGSLYCALDGLYYLENICFVSKNTFFSNHYDSETLFNMFNNYEYMLYALKNGFNLLPYATEELKSNKNFILETIKYGGSLFYASEELKKDKEVALAAVKKDGYAIKNVPEELKHDKEIMMKAVKKKGRALEFVPEELRNDKDVVLAAVKEDGEALMYASNDLKNDKKVVLAAVNENGFALGDASEELRNNKLFLLKAVMINGESLLSTTEKSIDNEIILFIASVSTVLNYIRKDIINMIKKSIKVTIKLFNISSFMSKKYKLYNSEFENKKDIKKYVLFK